MNIGTIVQSEMTLIPFLGDLPAQWSGNFEVGVTIDSQYETYTPYLSIGYMTDNIGRASLVAIENGIATIPPAAFEHSGLIMISIVLIKGEEQLVTKPLTLKVEHAPLLGAETTPSQTGIIAAVEAVVDAKIQSVGGLSEAVKQELLNCFANVAWIDGQGQTYYDALEAALYPPVNLVSISAVYNGGTVYNTATLDDLKADLVVTALYDDMHTEVVTDYTLFGTIAEGQQTIGVSYGGKATSFDITVIEWVVSISAVFSGDVYDDETLNDLKTDLVVTAQYSDSTTGTVPDADYTLSGTIALGEQTITVSYGGKTTTFTVVVTERPRAWYTGVPLDLGTVESGTISDTTGEDGESTTLSRTGYIDIEGAHIILSRVASTKVGTGNNAFFYFYDEDYDFISSKTFGSSNNKVTMGVVPQGTKYVRFRASNDFLGENATTPYEFVPYATPTVPYTAGDTSITSSTVTAGAIQADGTQNSASTKTSQFIPIYGAQVISALSSGSEMNKTFALYDKDENFMALVSNYGSTTITASNAVPYNQCAYMKLTSIWTSSLPITVTLT